MNRLTKSASVALLAGAMVVGAQGPLAAAPGTDDPRGSWKGTSIPAETPQPGGGAASTNAVFDPSSAYTANWTRAQALQISPNASNTTPRIPEEFPIMTDQVWVWDTWPLSDLDMNPVSYG